jgi:hypothetical protein
MAAGSAPSPLNYSNLADTAVLPDYADYLWELNKRKRLLVDSLEKNGAIQMADGGGGKYMDWLANVADFNLNDHADLGTRTFERVNTDVTYTAPYAFLETTDAISENDWGFLQTKQARNSSVKDRSKKVVEDQIKKLNRKLLQQNCDTNSVMGVSTYSGSQNLYGLPTLFAYGATARKYDPTVTTTVTTTVTAANKEVRPGATYCGISTEPLATIAGVPDNMRVQEATSPVIVNWGHNAWPYSGPNGALTVAYTTWAGNCLYVFDYMISRVNRDATVDYMPDIGLMPQDMYNGAKAAIRASTQQHVVLSEDPSAPDVGMFKRFFFNYMGVIMSWDIDMPTRVFYMLNTKKAKFRYVNAVVAGFQDGGPYETGKKRFMTLRAFPDANVGAFKFISKLGGQMIWQPNAQGAAYDFA